MSVNTVEYANQLLAENERLKEQMKQLGSENAVLKLRVVTIPKKAYVKSAGCSMVRWASLIDELSNAGVAFRRDDGELIASSRETPATDAWLNEVRAQGVDAAINHLVKKFEGTGYIGVSVLALEVLVAQLRAGEVYNGN